MRIVEKAWTGDETESDSDSKRESNSSSGDGKPQEIPPSGKTPFKALDSKALSRADIGEAKNVLKLWLGAWKRQSWGTLAELSHMNSLPAVKIELIESGLGSFILNSFESNTMRPVAGNKGHVTALAKNDRITEKPELIRYCDIRVIVTVDKVRVGITARLVSRNCEFRVSPHSINRRFDPKLIKD